MSNTNKKPNPLYILAFTLIAILIANSAYLSYKYSQFYYGGSLLSSFDCADDCDSVMMSQYALIFGVPVPFYGLLYFITIAVSFALLVKAKIQRKVFDLFLVSGCAFALYCLYLLKFALQLSCKFCMLSHCCLFAFTALYFIYLRK